MLAQRGVRRQQRTQRYLAADDFPAQLIRDDHIIRSHIPNPSLHKGECMRLMLSMSAFHPNGRRNTRALVFSVGGMDMKCERHDFQRGEVVMRGNSGILATTTAPSRRLG